MNLIMRKINQWMINNMMKMRNSRIRTARLITKSKIHKKICKSMIFRIQNQDSRAHASESHIKRFLIHRNKKIARKKIIKFKKIILIILLWGNNHKNRLIMSKNSHKLWGMKTLTLKRSSKINLIFNNICVKTKIKSKMILTKMNLIIKSKIKIKSNRNS